MADTTTEHLALLKPGAGSAGWTAKLMANLDNIDLYLAAEGEDEPEANVDSIYIGQRYFHITDVGPPVVGDLYIATLVGDAPDTGRWELFPQWLINVVGTNYSTVWQKGQKAKWYIAPGSPIASPYVPSISESNYHWLGCTAALHVDPPTDIGDLADASTLVLAFYNQNGDATFELDDAFVPSAGVTLPSTTVQGEVDLYSCILVPTKDVWLVTGAIKFPAYV